MSPIRLGVDGVRSAPPGWVIARTARPVIAHLAAGGIDTVSLDQGLVRVCDGLHGDRRDRTTGRLWSLAPCARHNPRPLGQPRGAPRARGGHHRN
ncbi:MAG: cyclic-phosphate processing receiver domain-containing protein [Acidiferrobacter sp.]